MCDTKTSPLHKGTHFRVFVSHTNTHTHTHTHTYIPSSDGDDVASVMSQIEPRSALDVPAFSLLPPAKQPTGIMTAPLQDQGGIGSSSSRNRTTQPHASTPPLCQIRRSKRLAVTRIGRALRLVRSHKLKSLRTQMKSVFEQISRSWMTSNEILCHPRYHNDSLLSVRMP